MKIHKDIKNDSYKYSELTLKEKYVTQEKIIEEIEKYIDSFDYSTHGYCYKDYIIKHLMENIRLKACVADLKLCVDEVVLKKYTLEVDEDANIL